MGSESTLWELVRGSIYAKKGEDYNVEVLSNYNGVISILENNFGGILQVGGKQKEKKNVANEK